MSLHTKDTDLNSTFYPALLPSQTHRLSSPSALATRTCSTTPSRYRTTNISRTTVCGLKWRSSNASKYRDMPRLCTGGTATCALLFSGASGTGSLDLASARLRLCQTMTPLRVGQHSKIMHLINSRSHHPLLMLERTRIRNATHVFHESIRKNLGQRISILHRCHLEPTLFRFRYSGIHEKPHGSSRNLEVEAIPERSVEPYHL